MAINKLQSKRRMKYQDETDSIVSGQQLVVWNTSTSFRYSNVHLLPFANGDTVVSKRWLDHRRSSIKQLFSRLNFAFDAIHNSSFSSTSFRWSISIKNVLYDSMRFVAVCDRRWCIAALQSCRSDLCAAWMNRFFISDLIWSKRNKFSSINFGRSKWIFSLTLRNAMEIYQNRLARWFVFVAVACMKRKINEIILNIIALYETSLNNISMRMRVCSSTIRLMLFHQCPNSIGSNIIMRSIRINGNGCWRTHTSLLLIVQLFCISSLRSLPFRIHSPFFSFCCASTASRISFFISFLCFEITSCNFYW